MVAETIKVPLFTDDWSCLMCQLLEVKRSESCSETHSSHTHTPWYPKNKQWLRRRGLFCYSRRPADGDKKNPVVTKSPHLSNTLISGRLKNSGLK